MMIKANVEITTRKIRGIDFEAFIAATSLRQFYPLIIIAE